MDMNLDYQTYNLYIGIIGVCAAIIVPIILHKLQKKEKRLVFEILQNSSVIKIDNNFKDEIETKYDKRLVNELFALTARIKNNGSLSIKKNDIITPIEINFKQQVIKCNVIERNPQGVEVYTTTNDDGNSVHCRFNLLNPHDDFTLQFISSEKLSTPTINSRIDGLSQIKITPVFEQSLLGNLKYDIDVSNGYHLRHSLYFPDFLEDKFSKPLYFYTLPGLVLVITGSYMLSNFIQNYLFGGHLRFLPTIFMFALVIVGTLMIFSGIIINSVDKSIFRLIKYLK